MTLKCSCIYHHQRLWKRSTTSCKKLSLPSKSWPSELTWRTRIWLLLEAICTSSQVTFARQKSTREWKFQTRRKKKTSQSSLSMWSTWISSGLNAEIWTSLVSWRSWRRSRTKWFSRLNLQAVYSMAFGTNTSTSFCTLSSSHSCSTWCVWSTSRSMHWLILTNLRTQNAKSQWQTQ